MNNPANIRNVTLVAALAAVGATAWAVNTSTSYTASEPAIIVAEEPLPTATQIEYAATPTETIPASESLSPNETVITTTTTSAPAAAPVVERSTTPQPSVTIEERRLTLDERLQANVMDVLLRAPNLTGKIGVESHDAVVTLTGWTTTAAMASRAGRHARGVEGVKDVQNEIRPRIGGSAV